MSAARAEPPRPAAAPRWRRRGFLLRVYLHGLVLLILSGVAVFGVGRLIVMQNAQRDARPLTQWMITRTAALRSDPAHLQAELTALKANLNLSMTLYDADGALIVSNVDPPAPLPSPEDLAALRSEPFSQRGPGGEVTASFFEEGRIAGYGIINFPRPQVPFYRGPVVIALVLLVLALASIPLARSVVSPVEKLAAVTRSFGEGNFSSRAHLSRKDEIGDLARAFDEMADRVAFLLRSEKELLANVSHELRTPLARIRVVLELASDADVEEARRYLGEIAEDLAELERLVDDVLTAARLELAGGKTSGAAHPLRLEPTELSTLIEKATSRFRESCPARVLVVEGAEGLPIVDADGPMLRRVLDNLLDNARKYSDDGSSIRIRARLLDGGDDSDSGGAGKRVVIEVADEGIGIEAADLEHAFTPFFRSDKSRARRTGGVGLGLTLARRIVEGHGGTIELESHAGAGTTVRFTVPVPAEPMLGDVP